MSVASLISSTMPDLLPMRDRSPGIHLSDIINDLSIRQGHYDSSPLNMARAQLGNALEWAMIERLFRHDPSQYIRLPEVERDGVYVTLDLLRKTSSSHRRSPFEFKLTYQSLANGPGSKGFWKYETQLASQCHVTSSETGILPVTFAMGDYKQDRAPAYREWEYQWTRRELIHNWDDVILRHRDRMIAESEYWKRVALGGER